MRKLFWLLLLLPLIALPLVIKKPKKIPKQTPLVKYELSGGRFGDNLIAYMHAKWVSMRRGWPLLYTPFQYSDKLRLHALEKHHDKVDLTNYSETRYQHPLNAPRKKKNHLFKVSYFPEALEENYSGESSYLSVDWNHKKFKKLLRESIAPNEPIETVGKVAGCFNLAVHVRLGCGEDDAGTVLGSPLKFPPISYYIAAIKKVHALKNHEPMHVFIFTDAKYPPNVQEEIATAFEGQAITFGCREKDNRREENILIDFFSMCEFDGLIRGTSSYAIAASKLADYQVEISPHTIGLRPNSTVHYIDSMNVQIR
ncbi:MAG: hypothetical protein SP1CHLAM54_13230 [Chlamydiia bacterium]|nr:hypothetical protein [Chlamydiia bacterium]MCH9616219.1 hypothetical protein [Chlamydiia bacterium]MCH9629795.1 hypothetical protein [Chlamydiia bacterium]